MTERRGVPTRAAPTRTAPGRGATARGAPAKRPRAGYIDWMRGLAVLIMILAHLVDSWTVEGPTRQTRTYVYFLVLAGMGAPMFLWLAGLAVPLAAHARMRRGATLGQASWLLQKRGWQIFGLAMLFRVQAYVFSAGATLLGLLKVDILNVMGLSLVAAAWLWGRARTAPGRIAIAATAVLVTLVLTPLARVWQWPDALPGPLEWYLRPSPSRGTFTLLPWSAFVFAGLAIGEVVAVTPAAARGVRLHRRLLLGGLTTAAAAYVLSFQPTVLPGSQFWTTSPAFFLLRLGLLIATFGLLYLVLRPEGAWSRLSWPRTWSPMELLGRSSLFIYWIHVELIYGVFSRPLHKALSLPAALAAFVLFTLLMLALAMAKARYWDGLVPWAGRTRQP